MPYIEEDELFARYRIFSANSGTNVASDIIYYAERAVEGALASKFTIPFDGPHPTVKDLVIDACFVRYMQRTDPKKGKTIYDAFMERIDRILNGQEMLVTGSGTIEPVANDADLPWSTTEDYYPVHSMLGPENEFTMVDSSRIYDLEQVRD